MLCTAQRYVAGNANNFFSCNLPAAASRPHHLERRPGDCDEARAHPGARPARGPAGQGGQRLHLLCPGRQVAQEGRRESIKGRRSKCNCPM